MTAVNTSSTLEARTRTAVGVHRTSLAMDDDSVTR